MRKFFAVAAAVALVVALAAASASASSNKADGTIITETNSGSITLGSMISCGGSSWSGPLTNNGAGAGITQSLTSVSFSACGFGYSWVACKLPWSWGATSSSDGVTWSSTIANACLDISVFGGATACRYEGTLTGGNYSESSDQLYLAGALAFTSGTSGCPTNPQSVSGQYTVTPTDLDLS